MIGLWLFLFAGLFTPGPNVILLFTSGAAFGLRRTVPHILGVAVGVGIIGAAVGLGLGALVHAVAVVKYILMAAAMGWIFYLAYRLWQAAAVQRQTLDAPFTFAGAVLFQWVNPKIWAVAMAALAHFDDGDPRVNAVILGGSFTTLNLGVCLFWTAAGGTAGAAYGGRGGVDVL